MSLFLASVLSGLFCISLGLGLRYFLKSSSSLAYLRHQALTLIVYSLACFWFLYKILHLGEADFGEHKHSLALLFGVLACLAYFYVPDFLLIRAFSILGLLLADAVLDAAYMQPYGARLVLVTGVYLGIVVCLIMGALPYVARTSLVYLKSNPQYGRALAYSFILYGLGLECSVFAYCS